MYIVNWLKGHPIISVWVLGLIAFLLYWSGSTNGKNAVLENNSVVVEHSESVKNESQTQRENVVNDKKESTSKNIREVETKNISVAEQAKDIISPTNNENALTKFKQQQTASSGSIATDIPSKGGALPENNQSDLNTSSNEDMLLIAREAYWNNGLDEAAEIYQKLIKLEPNVLDHKGELGNVYWRQGFPKKAAELYSEIAIPMIKDGKSEPVANMLGFIGLFYPDRAAQINDHLQAEKK